MLRPVPRLVHDRFAHHAEHERRESAQNGRHLDGGDDLGLIGCVEGDAETGEPPCHDEREGKEEDIQRAALIVQQHKNAERESRYDAERVYDLEDQHVISSSQ